jgi:bacillopeptidase F
MSKSKQGSRLSRTVENQSKKQLYIFIPASILLIAVSIFFGPRLLEFIGTYMISSQNEEVQEENNINFVTVPHFSALPEASESDKITISGTVTSNNSSVELYVNTKLVDTQKVTETNAFQFKNISLREGENTVKARAIVGDRKSEFTKDYIILYSKEPPKIEDVSPGDGSEFRRGDQEIRISGKTDKFNSVTVNDFTAVVDENGNFSYFLRLNDGDNKITIKAKNGAGKETIKEFTVRFSP